MLQYGKRTTIWAGVTARLPTAAVSLATFASFGTAIGVLCLGPIIPIERGRKEA